MPACTACGQENVAESAFCNRCGGRLETAPQSAHSRKTTDPSDRIMVTRSAGGEVTVEKVRAEGTFFRQKCSYCGRSVKVPEGTRTCPHCARSLDGAGGDGGEDPVVASPVPRDPALTVAVLCLGLPSGDERRIELGNERSLVGRTIGVPKELVIPTDLTLSPCHAEFRYVGDRVRVVDRDSLNGVFVRVREKMEIDDGAFVLMGEQVFRFERVSTGFRPPPETPEGTMPIGSGIERPGARLVKVLADGGDGAEFHLAGKRRVFGRQVGHYTFPDDPLMSQSHAMIEENAGRYFLTDLASTNGTLLKVRELLLEPGTVLRIGSQRFRIEYRPGRGVSGAGR